jgi:hypothetical protein
MQGHFLSSIQIQQAYAILKLPGSNWEKIFVNFDSKVSISFLNFHKFLVTAFALHDGVMLKGVDIVFVQTENEFVSAF